MFNGCFRHTTKIKYKKTDKHIKADTEKYERRKKLRSHFKRRKVHEYRRTSTRTSKQQTREQSNNHTNKKQRNEHTNVTNKQASKQTKTRTNEHTDGLTN